MKLNRHNLAVWRAASKDDSRYVLAAVQIDQDATVATNGHILAAVGLPADVGEVQAGLIQVKSIQAAEKTTTEKLPDVEINGLWRGSKGLVKVKKADGRFPNWRTVVPAYTNDNSISVCVSPALLRQVADILERTARTESACRITIDREKPGEKVIRFDAVTGQGQHVTVLLMPRRGTDAPLKDWSLTTEKPKEEGEINTE